MVELVVLCALYDAEPFLGLPPEGASGSGARRTALRRLRLSRSAAAARASRSAFSFFLC